MRRVDRVLTAVTFISVGPLAGALSLWFFSICTQFFEGSTPAFSHALLTLGPLIVLGYLAGLIPAITAGLSFAALPVRWQRVVVSVPIGAGASCLFGVSVDAISNAPMGNIVPILIGTGAVAAAVSAFVSRQLLNVLGRRYVRDGGIG